MKKPSYILKIGNPCKQNWGVMNESEQGKFCSYCSKAVTDFSNMTDEEVYGIINRTTTKICGRFTSPQLNRRISLQTPKRSNPFMKLLAGIIFLQLSVPHKLFGKQTNRAIINIHTFEVSQYGNKANVTDTFENKIQGKIVDSETNDFLPEATIMIKGTKIGALSDSEGNYSLKIPDSLLTQKIVFIVSCVGYSTQEFTVDREEKYEWQW